VSLTPPLRSILHAFVFSATCANVLGTWLACLVGFLEQAAPLLGDEKALEFAARIDSWNASGVRVAGE